MPENMHDENVHKAHLLNKLSSTWWQTCSARTRTAIVGQRRVQLVVSGRRKSTDDAHRNWITFPSCAERWGAGNADAPQGGSWESFRQDVNLCPGPTIGDPDCMLFGTLFNFRKQYTILHIWGDGPWKWSGKVWYLISTCLSSGRLNFILIRKYSCTVYCIKIRKLNWFIILW